MQKTKLGITVGMFGAMICFTALFGGYTAVVLLAGYCLLMEDNEWLKKTAVKAVAIMVGFAFLIYLVDLIPDLMSWINSLVSVFGGHFNYSIVSSIISVITKALDIIRTCLFLLLGVKAFNQGTVSVPVIDGVVDKNM